MASPLFTRVGLLGLGALALGACDLGLVLDPDPADPGDTVTVSNAEGPHCIVEEGDDGVPVDIIVITDLLEFLESEDFGVVASTATGEDGLFGRTIDAPERPGQHLVLAVCEGIPD